MVALRHLCFFLGLILLRLVVARDADFAGLLSQPGLLPQPAHIPKNAHFVFVYVKELTWMEYAAIRSAHDVLHVETINLWVPSGSFPGEMWRRILAIPGVVIRRTEIPDTVYGNDLKVPQHVSDIIRLKVLWEEGGIYMDTNLIALRSSDSVIYSNATRSSVMALQSIGGLCNALIMSKPKSPFLRRWMQNYTDFDDRDWDKKSVYLPHKMHLAGEPDLTVLDDHAWFYPIWGQGDNPLKTMWLGKSWHDIDRGYGVHFWHWETAHDPLVLSPEAVRQIDTPLFCRLRKLFDNLDGDGYYSVPPGQDPNCSIAHTSDITNAQGMFSDYNVASDTASAKWIDSSGHHLHGWAPSGTHLYRNVTDRTHARHFDKGSYAVLPVPVDWDARVGSAAFQLKVDPNRWQERKVMGLMRIRIETDGEILLSLSHHRSYGTLAVRFDWIGGWGRDDVVSKVDNVEWTSDSGIPLLDDEFHDVVVTFDRLHTGLINVFVDGRHFAQGAVSLVASPKMAREIWVNSRDFGNLDTDYRGWIRRLKMYARPLSLEDAAVERELFGGSSQSNALFSNYTSTVSEAEGPSAVVEPSRGMSASSVPNSGLATFQSSTSSLSRLFLMSVLIMVVYFVWRKGVFKSASGLLASSSDARGVPWHRE